MKNGGIFWETYGKTIQNLILEYLLENQDLDIAIGDMSKELKISKPKAYEIMKSFEKKSIIKKSRVVSKTQLYKLNKQNGLVQLYLASFNQCLKLVIEQEGAEEGIHSTPRSCSVGTARAESV